MASWSSDFQVVAPLMSGTMPQRIASEVILKVEYWNGTDVLVFRFRSRSVVIGVTNRGHVYTTQEL